VSRYFTRRPTAGKPLYIETPLWDDQEPHRPSLTVSDHEPSFTGLLDEHGDEIWRGPNDIGFHNPRGGK
jgi:hypothetical protein